MNGLEALLEAAGESETTEMMVNGKMESMVSVNGIVYAAYHGWKWYNNPTCEQVIRRYCQYISLHSCTGGASKLFSELDGKTDDDAIQWLKETIDKYVGDKIAMIEYVLRMNCKRM